MKKIFLTLTALTMLCACTKQTNTLEGILEETTAFTYEEKETTLGKIGALVHYIYIDLDGDQTKELVVELDDEENTYLIIHEYDGLYYANALSVREFEDLKSDGTFIGSDGAQTHSYCKISFNKANMTVTTLAYYDELNGEYLINEEAKTKEELETYDDEFQAKEDATWLSKEN